MMPSIDNLKQAAVAQQYRALRLPAPADQCAPLAEEAIKQRVTYLCYLDLPGIREGQPPPRASRSPRLGRSISEEKDLKPQERWRGLPSNKNYLISDHGRVMRFTRGKGTEPGRVLKPGKTRESYLKVDSFINGTSCSQYVQRLVVEAFIGEIPTGLEVNLISGQKVDNCIENLEVTTHAENAQHTWNTGLRNRTMFEQAA
jgi:hypothetical protein